MKMFFKVMSWGLLPLYDSDMEELKKLKIGNNICADVSYPRNIQNHKRYFGMLKLVLENLSDEAKNKYKIYCQNNLHQEIEKDLGMKITSDAIEIHSSISLEEMDELYFRRFFNMACQLVISKYLPVSKKDIEEELYKYL